ncbi:MAG: SDR family oxidoreductase [Phycisphaeraceae bacterium]|jgi:NADP-dependent 3-hydroxy acid dehydrogenase YdfG|nr:SDR family oxidoreductase [Phycisphaeraceae bacterium]
MSKPLQGRVAIVTGASAGIGLSTARHLADAGARLVINARRAEKLSVLAAEINSTAPNTCVPVAGDCADQATIDQMLNTAKRSFSADADLIIVNAGRGLAGSVVTSDTTQWDEMLRTNILGAATLIRAAGKRMLQAVPENQTGQHGSWLSAPARDIIVIGSVVGYHVSPFSSMYGSTKFAVHGMVEGVRRELGPKGIRVTIVAPGFVVSEFQSVAGYEDAWFSQVKDKIGPPLAPDDVARVITFIAAQPPAVHISEITVRPTRQDYP